MNLGLNTLGAGSSGLSLVRILGSLSKTVGIVKQFAPLYKEIKPLIQKAPVFLERLNAIRTTTSNFKRSLPLAQYDQNRIEPREMTHSSGPTFFQ